MKKQVKLVYCANESAELQFGLPTDYDGSVSCEATTCHYRKSMKDWVRVKDEAAFNNKDKTAVVIAYLQLEGRQDTYAIQMGKLIRIPSFANVIDHDDNNWQFKPNARMTTTADTVEFYLA